MMDHYLDSTNHHPGPLSWPETNMRRNNETNANCPSKHFSFSFSFFYLEPLPAFLESRQGNILTVLAWVQAERGSLQHCGVLADVPDVEVYEDWDGGEGSHSEPSQHEDVCQHDKLRGQTKEHGSLWRLLV